LDIVVDYRLFRLEILGNDVDFLLGFGQKRRKGWSFVNGNQD